MSTPPASQPPPQGYERPYYPGGLPPVPAPSGELVIFLLVWLVVGLVTLIDDRVTASQFVWASVALAIGYMLARGFAKLGKVYESR